jgi:hypothetical protein
MLTAAQFQAHARYYHRASIVIPYACGLAFWFGYFGWEDGDE